MHKTNKTRKEEFREGKPDTYFLIVRLKGNKEFQCSHMGRCPKKIIKGAQGDATMWGKIEEMHVVKMDGLTMDFTRFEQNK